MYGINEKVYKALINYFESNIDIKNVILFGSRANGTERINSDIDLCIRYQGKSKGTVIEEIDEVIGIYSCDILF